MVSITLTLDDLVTSTPGVGNFWLPESDLSEPAFDVEFLRAPTSAYIDGDVMLAARRTQSTLPLTIYCQAASSAALATMKAQLATVLWQYPIPITLTVDGVATVYEGWPSIPQWGAIDSGMARAHLARATCVIPVNP